MPYVVLSTIDRDLAKVEVKNRYLTNDFPTFRTNTAKQAFSNIILYMLITLSVSLINNSEKLLLRQ